MTSYGKQGKLSGIGSKYDFLRDKLVIHHSKFESVPYSLKNHGVDHEEREMFDMAAETMELPLEEKMKYEQGDSGSSFGYASSAASLSRRI